MDNFIRNELSGETIEPFGYPNGSLRVLFEAHTETSIRTTVSDGATTSATEVRYALSTGIFLDPDLNTDPTRCNFQMDFSQDLGVSKDLLKPHNLWREIRIDGIPYIAQYLGEPNSINWQLWLKGVNLLRDGREILGNLTITGRDIKYCNSFIKVSLGPYLQGRSKLL